MLRYTTDRAKSGLVALYDIWPGNGAGQFLQSRSPHGADKLMGNLQTCLGLEPVLRVLFCLNTASDQSGPQIYMTSGKSNEMHRL